MRAKTEITLDERAFRKMKRILPSLSVGQRHCRDTQPCVTRPMPEEIAFKLTNRCNLRCQHCYQWNEAGHHHRLDYDAQRAELDFSIIEKVLTETQDVKSNLFFWGGEPLIYQEWDRLLELLERDPRWTSICTNGIGLDKRVTTFQRISDHIEFLIAVDGFREEHAALRGGHAFDNTLRGIDALLAARANNAFRGEISINFVVSVPMIGRIYEFIEFFEQKRIDALYISLPWYVSPTASAAMDNYVARHFPWMMPSDCVEHKSWNAYKFQLDAAVTQRLAAELAKVNTRTWKIKVRYNPALEADELETFLAGRMTQPKNRSTCMALKSRMDILPNGDVVSCKFFPEFAVGNLRESSVAELWHCATLSRIREAVDQELMPVCPSCNLLYTRGI